MKYNFNSKTINIPDEVIDSYVSNLNLSIEEAIKVYLEDEGYLTNQEQEELTSKAKENRITASIHGARQKPSKKTARERVKKPNPTKAMIISRIMEILPEFATDITIEKEEKLITFCVDDKHFTLDLIQNRQK